MIFLLLNYEKHKQKVGVVLFCTTSVRKRLALIRCAVSAQDARRDACLCSRKIAAVNVCL